MNTTVCKQSSAVRSRRGWLLACIWVLASFGCAEPAPATFSYYEERIDPLLRVGCAEQTTGCHLADSNGFALGNLDLSSFDSLMRRRDALLSTGPYTESLLLLKGGTPITLRVGTLDPPDPSKPEDRFVTITTDIRHAGGSGVEQGAPAYAVLRQWLANGAARSGSVTPTRTMNIGSCSSGTGFLPSIDVNRPIADRASFDAFVANVQPVLRDGCSGSACHGQAKADLWLTCGDTDEELRWNYYVTLAHVSAAGSDSELLRRPLSTAAGGVYHEGGDVYLGTDEAGYQTLRRWVDDVVDRVPELLDPQPADEGLRFFANRVQPTLVRKGCMFMSCHSTAMFHDLRLRGGSEGQFSPVATARNYLMSREMLAPESADPNAGRLIGKNLFPGDRVEGGQGIVHRGGALLEDFSPGDGALRRATVDLCDTFDADNGDLNEVPAYCVLARWHAIEREAAIAQGEVIDDAIGVRSVVWVSRPLGVGRPEDFDTFRGGAELMLGGVSGSAVLFGIENARSLNTDCGLGSSPDIRGPAVSWDATRIAFAARLNANEPFRIYEMRADGTNCLPLAAVAASDTQIDGIFVHDFDPAYAPDGQLVFASTRGNIDGANVSGPTRTPASLAPNANLYVLDPGSGDVRQLTFLLDQEFQPSFKKNGRVIFTAEKRARDFHQFATRRLNLDGGDYHPLFAQRASVGFESATEVIELSNKNLAMVAGPLGAADGAGTIAVVNRSLGPDQDDRDPSDRSYLGSLRFPVPGAFALGNGAYRSPTPLPTGKMLVSCDTAASDLMVGPFDFDLCLLDPDGGFVFRIAGEAGRADVEAVAVYPRPAHEVFASRHDQASATTNVVIDPSDDDALVNYLDFPLLDSLNFTNTRIGRALDHRMQGFDVFIPQPPPSSATTFDALSEGVRDDRYGRFYESLTLAGNVQLASDGSAQVRVPGGVPLMVLPTDADGDPLMFGPDDIFEGERLQREAMQFYPGERVKLAVPRRLFGGSCGNCHGSITGRELDVAVSLDVLTAASQTLSSRDVQDLTN